MASYLYWNCTQPSSIEQNTKYEDDNSQQHACLETDLTVTVKITSIQQSNNKIKNNNLIKYHYIFLQNKSSGFLLKKKKKKKKHKQTKQTEIN